MAGVSFDDLIPQQPGKAGVSFDDLVPQPSAQPKSWMDTIKTGAGNAAQAADDIVRIIANGATFGLADNLAGVLPGGAGSIAAEHAKTDQAKQRAGSAGFVAELGSGIGSGMGLAKNGLTLVKEGQSFLPRLVAMAGEGAGYGGLTGFNAGDDLNSRIRDAITGVGLGGVGGGALGAAAGLGGKALGVVGDIYKGRFAPEAAAGDRLEQALQRSGKTAGQVTQALTDADAAGQGSYAVADALGKAGRESLSTVTRSPGPGQNAVSDFLEKRQLGQRGRLGVAIDQTLGTDKGRTAKQAGDELIAEGMAKSKPVYDSAFEGGSMAPLESHFQDAFGAAAEKVSQAEKALRGAQNAQTQSAAAVSRAGENVYLNGQALSADRAAAGGVESAQQALAAAQAEKEAIRARLQQAQADRSMDAPGAVWTPRVQQFLDDPITNQGLRKGEEIQRLEALAEGRPYNSKELAITGTNEAGDPIVSAVPNMRTLDAVKRGLDDILEQSRNDVTGRLDLDQRGRAIDAVRRSFLNHVDELNPTYAEARSIYAGPASVRDAIAMGRDNGGRGRWQDNLRQFNEASPTEQQGHRIGRADYEHKRLEKTAPFADAARPLQVEKSAQELGGMALPGKADEFTRAVQRETEMNQTFNRSLRGSDTSNNLANDHDFSVTPRAVFHLAHGNPLHMLGAVVRVSKDAMTGNTEAVRKELGDLLIRTGSAPDLAEILTRAQLNLEAGQRQSATLGRTAAIGAGEIAGSNQPRKRK